MGDGVTPPAAAPAREGAPATGASPAEVEVEVILPNILRDSAGGETRLIVPGVTLRDAMEALFSRHPTLRVHLYDERGRMRQHVLVFYNGESIRWLDSLDVPLRPGDQLQVINAVSGG